MTLNPHIDKDPTGTYWLRWDKDPNAIAYDIVTQAGKHVQAGRAKTEAKLGAGLVEPVTAQIAPAYAQAYETAEFPVPAPPPPPALTVTQSIADGATLTAPVEWAANPSADGDVAFFVDGVLKWTEHIRPYIFNGDGQKLDPATLANGPHELSVIATTPAGTAAATSHVTVNVTTPPPPPPSGSDAGRVLTYPDMSGGWLDASARNAADHAAWNAKLDRVLYYGNPDPRSWFPGCDAYQDSYAIYRSGGPGTPPARLPECVLKTADGKYVYIDWPESDGSYRQYAADPGNQKWRDDFVARSKAVLAGGGKGIYWDDFNFPFRFNDGAGHKVVPVDPRTGGLMTQDNWCRYMVEFAEHVAAAAPAEHCFNTIWFFGDHTGKDQWTQRLCKIPGAVISYERGFIDSGLHGNIDPADEWSFGRYMQHMDNMHKAGARIYTRSYASTEQQALFNLAATLLVSQGGDFQGCRFGMVPSAWWAPHDTNFGVETVPRRTTGSAVLRRDFARGWVEADFAARVGKVVKV